MDARSDSSTAARFRDDRDAEQLSLQVARSLQAAAVALREATRTCTAAMAASTEMAIISRYSTVRRWMVSGSPTAGGDAGYFANGTR
jgi:hypothetical protein